MVEVDLNHIYKKYEGNDKYSVNDFDLHIKDKEFIVFVGPSGCGKSTTLRMVAGLEDISKGTLEIDHKVMNDVAPKDRHIAMVFQNYALYPHMTIYDNMAFGLKLRHTPKDVIDKKVKDAAKMLGLEEYLDKRPGALSGGQRQRVALGRAIVRAAPIFLMDEPLSILDAILRVTMRTEIAKLHQELGTTTIYVTHDQTEAMTLADRVVVMSVGHVEQIGSPLEVYNKPVNMFVAGFIGSPQMNFFNVHYKDGRISDGKGLNIGIPEGKAKMLNEKGYNDKDLVFGIRPEDIHSEEAFMETWPDSVIESKVVVSELLGATIQLHQEVDGTEFTAIVNSRDYHKPGDMVKMGFDVNKAHFFDKDTTKAIVN